MPSCILETCSNRTYRKSYKQEELEKKQKITFHTFPKNTCRQKQWCEILQLPENTIKSNSVICSMHFHEESFDKSSQRYIRLKADANPYLLSQTSSMQRKSPIKCIEQIYIKKCTVTSEKSLSDNEYHTQSILDLQAENISTEQMDTIQNIDAFNMEMLVCEETTNKKRRSSNVIAPDAQHFTQETDAQLSPKISRATSVSPCKIYNSPSKKQLRKELRRTKEKYNLRIKTLTQKTRRMKKKIASLKNVLEAIKQKNFLEEEQLYNLRAKGR
ncbi:uncharacterized protein [Linepithema humile]|uniref:uncharacterized protein isoform X2 n=1 Tax=Linepithema humile TaxID=83485 RepID=UPI00351EA113